MRLITREYGIVIYVMVNHLCVELCNYCMYIKHST